MQKCDNLEREAAFILGQEIFNELKEWYLYTFRGDREYVFFITRRSYLLALIFESITGKRMEKQPFKSFYTDSAIPLLVTEFATRYREWGSFPGILICDDLLIHGRNINFLAADLERRLIEELSEYDSQEISLSLMEAIQINVHTCSSDKLLLRERYLIGTHYTRAESAEFYYRLSGNISSLILDSGFVNATYVVSELISESDFIKNGFENDFVKTSFQNNVQYAEVLYCGSSSTVKAAATLRLVKNEWEKGYRAVPFVFLPNLDMQETLAMHQRICGKMLESEYFTNQDKEYLDFLLEQDGLRSYSEFITMILSYAVLQEFNRRYHIKISPEDVEREVHKVSLNYPNRDGYDVSGFIQRLLWHSFLSDLETVDDIILNSLSEGRYLFNVSQNLISYTDEDLLKQLEDSIYSMGYTEERNAFLLLTDPSFTGKRHLARQVRGCGFLLREMAEHKDSDTITKLISYFLQMLDAGTATLSSLGGSGMKVCGLSQFAKAGELSLLLYPLRFIEYMPFLADMHQDCMQWARELEDELVRFQKSGMGDIEDAVFDKILLFCQKLKGIGQSPEDWNGNFALRAKLKYKSEKNDKLSQIMHLISIQRRHVENYERYWNKRIR